MFFAVGCVQCRLPYGGLLAADECGHDREVVWPPTLAGGSLAVGSIATQAADGFVQDRQVAWALPFPGDTDCGSLAVGAVATLDADGFVHDQVVVWPLPLPGNTDCQNIIP